MSTTDISMFNTDLKKLLLLYTLTHNSTHASAILDLVPDVINFIPSDYEKDIAIIKKGYIDRFKNQVIKADLSGNTFDTFLYNRDNGTNAAEKIVSELIKSIKP